MKNANTQPGDFDQSFGQNGIVEIPPVFAPMLPRNVAGMARQDDHILVATLAADERGGRHYGIVRLASDGSQDPTFGDNGLLVGRFDPNEHAQPEALATLGDGSIVMLGLTANPAQPAPQPKCAVFSKDGKGLEKEFALQTPENSALVIGSGRLAASATHLMITLNLASTTAQPAPAPRIYRMDHAGNPGFPHGSFIDVDLMPGEHEVCALSECQDGFIVAGTHSLNGQRKGFIARYDNTGKLDPTFGTNGFITLSIDDQSTAISTLLQRPNGALIALGEMQAGTTRQAWAWQFTAEGAPDPAFNNASPVQEGTINAWHSATLDADGRLIAFGQGGWLAYKRYLADGSPDNDYQPQPLIGITDAMMCLNHGSNTLLAFNATAVIGVIGTVAAIQN
ncbi:hypothetical protein ACQKPE_15555 [Pseudomonas sp. NPDC089554]|uniref:hypothetical protein n=1 Tax=Pseudomonas sp. NPDC089554 TaxID=3390653 RepID=UPI003D04527A